MHKETLQLLAGMVLVMSNAVDAAPALHIERLSPCGPWAPGPPRVWCVQVAGMGEAMPDVLLDGTPVPAAKVSREGQTLRFELPRRQLASGPLWLRDEPRESNPTWLSMGQSHVQAARREHQVLIADRLVTVLDLVGLLLREDVDGLTEARRIAQAHGLEIVGAIAPLNIYQVRLPSTTLLERDAQVRALGRDPAVAAVLVEDDNLDGGPRPDRPVPAPDREGWVANRFEPAVELYRRHAREVSAPHHVTVGVIEKGVNFDSPDFAELATPSGHAGVCLNARHSTAANAHGSIVTGVLAARIMPGGNRGLLSRIGALGEGFRVIVDRGSENGVLGRVAASVNLVQDHARVLNWSWGVHRLGKRDRDGEPVTANVRSELAFTGYAQLLRRFFAWLERDHADVLVVNSAGNSATTTEDHLPSALRYPQLLVVGAHQRSGRDVAVDDARFVMPRGKSNVGPRIDITAAACPRPPVTTAPQLGRGSGCGTSYAAALVTAVVAAMLAVNPDLHPTQIKTLLQRSAMPAFGQSARLDMREALRQAMHSRVQRDG